MFYNDSPAPSAVPTHSALLPTIEEFPFPSVARKLSWNAARGTGAARPSLIPFFGAGASAASSPKPAGDQGAIARGFPKGRDLALDLAEQANGVARNFPDAMDLGKSARYYEIIVGRNELREELHGRFHRDAKDMDATIQDAITSAGANMFFTTNYDALIEHSLSRRGAKFVVAVEVIDPIELRVVMGGQARIERVTHTKLLLFDYRGGAKLGELKAIQREQFDPHEYLSEDCSIVYKMHGSVCPQPPHSQFLISDKDYVNFMLNRSGTMLPAKVAAYVQTRNFLFLGYSLRDWNFRLLFAKLSDSQNANGRRNAARSKETDVRPNDAGSFAVMLHSSRMDQEIWQASSVRIFSGELSDFAVKMVKAVQNLKQNNL